ncbi:hypothetical protein D3260_06105 [Salinisphaera sp. Q1T1-3]|nr:hypothetical protein D3260_06105 [Salinisphaera sp. Q1T1-3]
MERVGTTRCVSSGRMLSAVGALALGLTGIAATAGAAEAPADGEEAAGGFLQQAEQQWVRGIRLHGRVGLYDFYRDHNLNQPFPGQRDGQADDDYELESLAVGGNIYAETGTLYGFSAGLGFSFAQALRDKTDYNPNLVGATGHYRTLNRAYLQYNIDGVRVRAGRQNIYTPFASDDQFAFIPRSFAGFSVAVDPLALTRGEDTDFDTGKTKKGTLSRQRKAPVSYDNDLLMPMTFAGDVASMPKWRVYFARMYKYESRQSDHFADGNRYVDDTSGFYTLGTHVRQRTHVGDYIAQVWHYNFNDTADLQYVEAGYQTPALLGGENFSGIRPYARVQYVHETEAGAARLGNVDAQVYGAKFGVRTAHVNLAAVGHYAPRHEGSFRNGGVVHPYTDLSGLFYTDTMNDGVGDLGPGYGYGGRLDIQATDNISGFTRYVRYLARDGQSHNFYNYDGPRGFAAGTPITHDEHSWGWDTGVTFDLGAISDKLAGVQIQNTLGITGFENSQTFYDDRFRLFYKF